MNEVFELHAVHDGYPPGCGYEWAFDNLPHDQVVRMMAQELAVGSLAFGLADADGVENLDGLAQQLLDLTNQFTAVLEADFAGVRTARPQVYANLQFRSVSERRIAQALDRAAADRPLAYFPNCRGRFGLGLDRENREPDFLVVASGVLGVLEVDGPLHDVADDQARDALFATHGIRVRRFPSDECFENSDGVVEQFLSWLADA